MLTLGSLFDGSGGFPLGATLAGIKPLWASEIEPFPIWVTHKNFPGMKHLGDVSKICGAEIDPVDIITFGSPCQDMSTAGKRAGLDGSRSGLFHQAIRIIKEMREATNDRYHAIHRVGECPRSVQLQQRRRFPRSPRSGVRNQRRSINSSTCEVGISRRDHGRRLFRRMANT